MGVKLKYQALSLERKAKTKIKCLHLAKELGLAWRQYRAKEGCEPSERLEVVFLMASLVSLIHRWIVVF